VWGRDEKEKHPKTFNMMYCTLIL